MFSLKTRSLKYLEWYEQCEWSIWYSWSLTFSIFVLDMKSAGDTVTIVPVNMPAFAFSLLKSQRYKKRNKWLLNVILPLVTAIKCPCIGVSRYHSIRMQYSYKMSSPQLYCLVLLALLFLRCIFNVWNIPYSPGLITHPDIRSLPTQAWFSSIFFLSYYFPWVVFFTPRRDSNKIVGFIVFLRGVCFSCLPLFCFPFCRNCALENEGHFLLGTCWYLILWGSQNYHVFTESHERHS